MSCLPATREERAAGFRSSATGPTVSPLVHAAFSLSNIGFRWLYALFLGIDANFRLQRKLVSNNTFDPGLSHGYSYFVEDVAYKDYLAPRMGTAQEVCVFLRNVIMTHTICLRKAPATATMP
jgi:hypothetical protein